MKKKILVAGGRSQFVGPRVHLEDGVWLVGPTPPNCAISIMFPETGELQELNGKPLKITGPSCVQVVIGEASIDVHLDAQRIA